MSSETKKRDNKYLKPSDKNGIAYLLDHVEAIRKRIDSGLGDIGTDPTSASAYQNVATLIYWKALVTFNCFKTLWFGGFTEDAKTLLRTLLEADVKLAFIAEDSEHRARLYQKASAGESKRLLALMKEVRTIVDQSTGMTVPETGKLIQNMEHVISDHSDESEAYRFWKRLTFKELCIRTGRSYEYILYGICSQVIHASPNSLLPSTIFESHFHNWILLRASFKCFLSIAASFCDAFGLPDVIEYIEEVRRWLHQCDAEWSTDEVQKLINSYTKSPVANDA